jgi:L-alanine-DL-glutamate epimerase-like enolase superfamily enzyme
MRLHAVAERWIFKEPFRITGYTMEAVDVVVVTLEQDGFIGKGEGAGVYYLGDDVPRMLQQLEQVCTTIEAGIDADSLQRLLPGGGARNALDCAWWDLQAKLSGRPVWELAGLQQPAPLLTTFTCGAGSPEQMAATARGYPDARAIKLKLTGEPIDADRVRAVRDACPQAWLAVDANQGFERDSFQRLLPVLIDARVALIEQPFRRGDEAALVGLRSPIPIAADESVQGLAELPGLLGKVDVINIKLDKCGGLTEGLAMARAARELGLGVMVGNMLGTSLAMAPAALLGQLCRIVDLDGPVFLRDDRATGVRYADGQVTCPAALWGYPTSRHS